MRGKLGNKIFLMVAAVSIVPVLIAGLVSVWSTVISHRIDVARIEDGLVDQKGGEVDAFMGDLEGKLQLHSDQVGSIPVTSQTFILTSLIRGNAAVHDVAFLNLTGQEVSGASQDFPTGVAPSGLRDQSHSEEFTVARNGLSYVGPVSYKGGTPFISLASPMRDKDGHIILVLRADINLSSLQTIVRETSVGETGYLVLADAKGNLIASRMEKALNGTDSRAFVSQVLSEKDFSGPDGQQRYTNASGDSVVATGRYLSDYRWALIAEWPIAEADAIVNQLLYRNLLIIVLVIFAAIGASALLAIFIVRPIKTLEHGTERVAKGEFDEPIDIHTNDEIEELGTAFNKMMTGLKELRKLKDEFVFIAAHELRTPVAAMKGYLELILEGTKGQIGDQTSGYVQKLIASNNRLIQLVNDLLEISRSEAGQLVIKVMPVALPEAVQAAISELKPLAEKSSITIRYDSPQDLPKVMGDSDRLKEVLINLIGNSIKYMGGAGEVIISHEAKDKEVITRVRDTGVGISKEAQSKLFEKFYRVQTEKTKDITGTGLGLFIVKQIIEKMNGKIWVESEEGKGSTFSFSLSRA